VVQALFIVINENRGGDMHGVTKHKSFLYAAFFDDIFNLSGYI
jgi:hypothetical protein